MRAARESTGSARDAGRHRGVESRRRLRRAKAGDLLMPVVWTGDEARAIASRLKNGIAVRIRGSLRATQSRMRSGTTGVGVEVVAEEIELADEALSDSIRKTNNG